MSHVIHIAGFANGTSCPYVDEYLETMDFETCGEQMSMALMQGDLVTQKKMHAVISSKKTNPKIVGVVLHKLRKKLRSYGIEITTVWSCGFKLADPDKARELFEEEKA